MIHSRISIGYLHKVYLVQTSRYVDNDVVFLDSTVLLFFQAGTTLLDRTILPC